jgi:hypothetical protein
MSVATIEYIDITLRHVPCRGWLYIVGADGGEAARGEFKPTAAAALDAGLSMAARLWQVQP